MGHSRFALTLLLGLLSACGAENGSAEDAGVDAAGGDEVGDDRPVDAMPEDAPAAERARDARRERRMEAGCGDDHDEPGAGEVFIDVDTGRDQTCARNSAGAVWCWGRNDRAQMGQPADDVRVRPVRLCGFERAAEVVASSASTLVRLADGRLLCWSSLDFACGAAAGVAVEVLVVSEAVDADAHLYHACAVDGRGTVACWSDRPTDWPRWRGAVQVEVSDAGHVDVLMRDGSVLSWSDIVATDAVEIDATGIHTCARHRDGSISCWGANDYGQIGRPPPTGSATALLVPGLPLPAVQVGAGSAHSCAVLENATVWCWGHNGGGQLGDGTTTTRHVPARVIGLDDVLDMAAGGGHTCAVRRDGSVWCWGANTYGELGDGTTENRPLPTRVVGLPP